MNQLWQAVGFGLVTAAILALSAVAMSLQYGVTRIPNFAHGGFLTVGAYSAYVTQRLVQNLAVSLLAGAVAGAAVAWLLDMVLLEQFIRVKAKPLTLFVVTLGASFVIDNVVLLIFGGTNQSYALRPQTLMNVGPFKWTITEIYIMIGAMLAMGILHVGLKYTTFGKAQRAVADDRELAAVTGIKTQAVIGATWLITGFLAGAAGVVLALQTGSFVPSTGTAYLLITFSAAIVGGIGRPYGAMAGSVIVGITIEVTAAYSNAAYKEIAAFALLILVLLFRPAGLFSRYARTIAQ